MRLSSQAISVLQHVIGAAPDGTWGPRSRMRARAAFPGLFPEAHPTVGDFEACVGMQLDDHGNPDWNAWVRHCLDALNELPGVNIDAIRLPFGEEGVEGVAGVLAVQGVCLHYTGSPRGDEVCREEFMANGTDSLVGPYYNFVLNKNRTASFITNGRTHNAGIGEPGLAKQVASGKLAAPPWTAYEPSGVFTFAGNKIYLAVSADGKPGVDGYEQSLENAIAVCAAMLTPLRSKTATVVGHQEHKRTKNDPGVDMGKVREKVHGYITHLKDLVL